MCAFPKHFPPSTIIYWGESWPWQQVDTWLIDVSLWHIQPLGSSAHWYPTTLAWNFYNVLRNVCDVVRYFHDVLRYFCDIVICFHDVMRYFYDITTSVHDVLRYFHDATSWYYLFTTSCQEFMASYVRLDHIVVISGTFSTWCQTWMKAMMPATVRNMLVELGYTAILLWYCNIAN